MKTAILNFLRNGVYTGTKYTADDFIEKLFFLKNLIKVQSAVPMGVISNDNPFWFPPNKKNRDELIQAVENIKKFSVNDTSFFGVINRFENGDCFGIRKPVPRSRVEMLDEQQFTKACAFYGLKDSKIEEFRQHGYFKLIYCYEGYLPYQDFESWTILEEILEIRINFVEYRYLDSLIYTFPKDLDTFYMTPEYCNTVLDLKAALSAERGKRLMKGDSLVTDIINYHIAGKLDKAYGCWCKLHALFTHCEGDSEQEIQYCQKKLQERLAKVPNQVVYDVTDYGIRNSAYWRSYIYEKS